MIRVITLVTIAPPLNTHATPTRHRCVRLMMIASLTQLLHHSRHLTAQTALLIASVRLSVCLSVSHRYERRVTHHHSHSHQSKSYIKLKRTKLLEPNVGFTKFLRKTSEIMINSSESAGVWSTEHITGSGRCINAVSVCMYGRYAGSERRQEVTARHCTLR